MAPKLSSTTLIQTVSGFTINYASNTELIIEKKGENFTTEATALTILYIFSTPKSFSQGIEELGKLAISKMEWIQMTQKVHELFEKGFLVDAEKHEVRLHHGDDGSFGGSAVHLRMLNDKERTQAFQRAIQETVKPEDVVLDIGTGTGILAALAARSGAKKVYALERVSELAKLAGRVFKQNGLDRSVHVLEGDASGLELSEKADVLIAELIGNDPLEENILTTTMDAVARLIKPGGRLIPDVLKIFAIPLTIPEPVLDRHFFTPANIQNWREWYQLDFTPLSDLSENQLHFSYNPADTKNWNFLSGPVLIADISLRDNKESDLHIKRPFEVIQAGLLNGLMICFEAALCPSVTLSTLPAKVSAHNHWASKICLPKKPIWVKEGDALELEYRYDADKGSQLEVTLLS